MRECSYDCRWLRAVYHPDENVHMPECNEECMQEEYVHDDYCTCTFCDYERANPIAPEEDEDDLPF